MNVLQTQTANQMLKFFLKKEYFRQTNSIKSKQNEKSKEFMNGLKIDFRKQIKLLYGIAKEHKNRFPLFALFVDHIALNLKCGMYVECRCYLSICIY